MLSPEPALAAQAKDWEFLELWIDLALFPPKVLMLIGSQDGSCRIFNPGAGYTLIMTHPDYESAREWLLEDEYERVQGQRKVLRY